jgi:hypothetical protein
MKKATNATAQSKTVASQHLSMDALIEHSHEVTALDEMLGLVDYQEMYEALDLPVVALLRSKEDSETMFAVISGERHKDHYEVGGISFGIGADGFTGKLSLDGTRLTLSSYKGEEYVEGVSFSATTYQGYPLSENRRGLRLNTLIGEFSGNYGPHEPIDCVMSQAKAAANKIKAGEGLHAAIVAVCDGDRQEAPGVFRVLKGWYRAYQKGVIMERHRNAFLNSGETLVMEYAPIREELAALNGEIGREKARLNRAARSNTYLSPV